MDKKIINKLFIMETTIATFVWKKNTDKNVG